MNNSKQTEIYVHFLDGALAFIPIPAIYIKNTEYEILENSEFDYEDDSILFEFGPGDNVKTKPKKCDYPKPEGKIYPAAYELVKSGNIQNSYKRLLFNIVYLNPEPSVFIPQFPKLDFQKLMTQNQKNEFKYLGITNWIKQYRIEIEEFLK
jgi:hypothetical protein